MSRQPMHPSVVIAIGALATILAAGAMVTLSSGPVDAACAAPTVQATTNSAPVGSHVRVTGIGWLTCDDTNDAPPPEPLGPVTIWLAESAEDDSGPPLGLADVDAAGNLDDVVWLAEDAPTGSWQLRASGTDGTTAIGDHSFSVTSEGPVLGRRAGENRIETAIAVSRRAYPDGSPAVYLARSDVPFDAMVGATADDGPILLVPGCELPDVVADEIDRLSPAEILGLGGPAAVCDEVLGAAGDGAVVASTKDLTLAVTTGPQQFTFRLRNDRPATVDATGWDLERQVGDHYETVPRFIPDVIIFVDPGMTRTTTFGPTYDAGPGDERELEPGRYRLTQRVEDTASDESFELAVEFDVPDA